MRGLGLLAAALALTACDLSETADKAMRRTAETVVQPVVDDYLPGDQAEVADVDDVGLIAQGVPPQKVYGT